MAPTLWWFDLRDDRKGRVRPLGSVTCDETLNGADLLRFTCRERVAKDDRLLWRDGVRWREHVATRVTETGAGLYEVEAEGSLCELLGTFIEETRLVERTGAEAVTAALAGSRWTPAAIGAAATVKGTAYLFHESGLAALRHVADYWGCDVDTSVEVAGGRVSTRTAALVERLGENRGVRLEVGRNVVSLACTDSEQTVTALYGYGVALPSVDEDGKWLGGYKRRVSFAEVNDGVAWVGDEDARCELGRWNADRTELQHVYGCVTFSEEEEPENVLRLTRWMLAERRAQQASFVVRCVLREGQEVRPGDDVAVIVPGRWRIVARAKRVRREWGAGCIWTVWLGALERDLTTAQGELGTRVDAVAQTAAEVSAVVPEMATTAYVDEQTAGIAESVVASIPDFEEEEF